LLLEGKYGELEREPGAEPEFSRGEKEGRELVDDDADTCAEEDDESQSRTPRGD